MLMPIRSYITTLYFQMFMLHITFIHHFLIDCNAQQYVGD